MTQLNQEQLAELFEAYTDGRVLSEHEKSLLLGNEIWAERVQSFDALQAMGEMANEHVPVPSWNPEMAFNQYLAKPSWWQTHGMSAAALCFSVFACAVMLFDLRVTNHDGQFALTTDQAAQQSWMQQEFQQLAKHNQTEIDHLLANFEQKQNQNTAKLVTYVLDSTRTERKEEIAEFVHMLQQQRDDDLHYLKQEFRDINYNLRLSRAQSRDRLENPLIETQLTE